jgi:conjugal transfer pilus assembly protein TraL
MSGEGDKYNFPETMNQQDRYLGLPIDELIVTAPLLVLGVLNNLSLELGVIAGILWFIVRYLKKGRGHTGYLISVTGTCHHFYSK